MKLFKEHEHYCDTHIRRWIGLFLASCFFMAVVAFAMHHHDAYFPLKNCAICKAKTSLYGTLNKIKADITLAAAIGNLPLAEVYLTVSRIKYNHQPPFIASLLPNQFLNKAPPFLS
jgi:hypothetical protein